MADNTIDSEVRDILYATDYFDASTYERYEEVANVTKAITNLIAQEANKVVDEAVVAELEKLIVPSRVHGYFLNVTGNNIADRIKQLTKENGEE